MNAFDMFLIHYGLTAIVVLLLVKSIGVPIPIPADVIILTAAAWAAGGKLVLWQAIVAILLAIVLGGMIQYVIVRGAGRGLLYRFGRYLGLTPPRLDAASVRIKKGGMFGVGLAILVPGVRGVAIAASGLAGLPVRTFLPGLVLGSSLFVALHVFLGFLGGSLFMVVGKVLPSAGVVLAVLALLIAVFALWLVAYRRQKAERQELAAALDSASAAAVEVWHEGMCPVCLALYTANQLRPFSLEVIR